MEEKDLWIDNGAGWRDIPSRPREEEWEEIKPWEEVNVADDREYANTEAEQAQRMEGFIGPELNRRLEIAAAKLEVIEEFKQRYNRQRLDTAFIGVDRIMDLLSTLEQEVKGEL